MTMHAAFTDERLREYVRERIAQEGLDAVSAEARIAARKLEAFAGGEPPLRLRGRLEDWVRTRRIREFARSRIEVSNLRAVGAEIGIKHTTLANFVHGACPVSRIRRKLEDWYAQQGDADPAREVVLALEQLLSGIPDERVRAAAVDETRAFLAALHASGIATAAATGRD